MASIPQPRSTATRKAVRVRALVELGDGRVSGVLRSLDRDGLSLELAAGKAPEIGERISVQVSGPSDGIKLDGQVVSIDAESVPGRLGVELALEASEGRDGEVDALLELYGGTVVLYGFAADVAKDLLHRAEELEAETWQATSRDQLFTSLAAGDVAVLCVGGELKPTEAKELLDAVVAEHPDARVCQLVLAAGSKPELFQDLIDTDRLFYLTQHPPPLDDILGILQSAVAHIRRDRADERSPGDEERLSQTQHVLQIVRMLAAETRADRATRMVAHAVLDFVDAERGECLIYDPATETLWNRDGEDGEERRESAAAGLISFVARTGQPVRLDHVGEDPRYEPEADNDRQQPDERFLAVPIIDAAADRGRQRFGPPKVLAVLVALRPASALPFGPRELAGLQLLADHVAPVFARMLLQEELDAWATRRQVGDDMEPLFRREAIEHHSRGFGGKGHVLEISPRWTAWAFRVLLFVLAAGLLYTVLGSVHEYAAGQAVITVDDRVDVTATLSGTVTAVDVEPGEKVAAGQLLVRFYGAQEAADLRRIERELELGLVDRLRNPADRGVERSLAALRAQKQLAEARLEERTLRAPQPGAVSDLRIRPGQHLNVGQVVLSLVDDKPEMSIVAMLPGQDRPLLRPGMPLRLELQGYPYAYQHLRVDEVAEEVVGPSEARRVLGAGIGDALQLAGSVVLVRAHLPRQTFVSEGETYAFHDGMLGTAEVRVRSEPILVTLIPGLKALFSDRHGRD